jgi:hypothetical protein
VTEAWRLAIKQFFQITHLLLTADEKIFRRWWCVWWDAENYWLWGAMLVHYWYRQKAPLLHTDRKYQVFQLVSELTIYYIILWTCIHILDQSTCDLKMWNKHRCKKDIGTCKFSSLGTMISEWVLATFHSLRNLAHLHPPAFLAGIFSWAGNYTSNAVCFSIKIQAMTDCNILSHCL